MDHDNGCWFSELTQSQPHNRLGRSHFYNEYIPQKGDKINRCTTDELSKQEVISPWGGRGDSLTHNRFSYIIYYHLAYFHTLLPNPSNLSVITYSFSAISYVYVNHLTADNYFSYNVSLLRLLLSFTLSSHCDWPFLLSSIPSSIHLCFLLSCHWLPFLLLPIPPFKLSITFVTIILLLLTLSPFNYSFCVFIFTTVKWNENALITRRV